MGTASDVAVIFLVGLLVVGLIVGVIALIVGVYWAVGAVIFWVPVKLIAMFTHNPDAEHYTTSEFMFSWMGILLCLGIGVLVAVVSGLFKKTTKIFQITFRNGSKFYIGR